MVQGSDTFVLETRLISSLSKVFPDEELKGTHHRNGSALWNETYAFQIAYRGNRLQKGVKVKVVSDFGERLTIRTVGLVPSMLPAYHDHDEDVLRTTPGLYPDTLVPINETEGLTVLPMQWRSIWVSVDVEDQIKSGSYEIRFTFEHNLGELWAEEIFELEIISVKLPKQKLIHTEWLHVDCLATQYQVEVFSERHWQIIDLYVQSAVKHGINMILTPLFTPPLDTLVGGERPTVQLVDVEIMRSQSYQFRFDRLMRWVDLCRNRGIEYFEFSHLFTQWGAEHAPKIFAVEKEEYKRIFGWETDASGKDYREFLKQFLTALILWIKDHGLDSCCYFHISDEPTLDQLATYEKASRMVQEQLAEFPIIDALSDYDFYERGLVKNPVPASDHIEPFLKNKVENLWTYYCCVQYKEVANRFFNMSSARNRILGIQLYKYQITGFLHWGFNFWYSQYSLQQLNPFQCTDAGHSFPSGDAFLVYPGEEGVGPIESIRLEVLQQALQDLRALQQLECLKGREYVLKALEEDTKHPITFSNYPRDEAWLLKKREWVNNQIKMEVEGWCIG